MRQDLSLFALSGSRSEEDGCEYEDGFKPSQNQRPPGIDNVSYTTLQSRQDRLESVSQTHTAMPTSSNASRHSDHHRAADQERIFTALAGLATVSDRGVPKPNGMTGVSELFPNIMDTSTIARSHTWTRNMSQIFEALPNKPLMDMMVDFYFTEVQVLRKSPTLEQANSQNEGDTCTNRSSEANLSHSRL